MSPDQKDFLLEAYKASNDAVKEQGNKRNYVLAAYAVIGSFLVKDFAFSSNASAVKELSPLYYLIIFSILSLTAIICLSLLCLYRVYNRRYSTNIKDISQVFYGAKSYSGSTLLTGITVDSSIPIVSWFESESVVPVGFALTTFMIEAFIGIFFCISLSEAPTNHHVSIIIGLLILIFVSFTIIKYVLLCKMRKNLAKLSNHLSVYSGIL